MSKDKFPMKDQSSPQMPETNELDTIDTSLIDEHWAELTKDWQEQTFKKTDIDGLLRQTRRRTLWAKSCFGLNVVATIGLLISFVYGIFQNEFGKPWNTYLGLGGLLSLIFVYYEIQIRAKAWSQISDSPEQAVENALAGYQSSLKYMVLTKWSCLPFGLLANWFVYSVSQENDKSAVPAFIFINVFIGIMYLITDVIHRKRKKEYRELMARLSN